MNNQRGSGFLLPSALMLVVVAFLLFAINQCEQSENSRDLTHQDQVGTWQRICLEGHVRLIKHKSYQGYALTKFNDDGTPVKCKR